MQESGYQETGQKQQLILVTGGAYQGQAAFAAELAGMADGGEPWTVWEDLHLRIAEMMRQGEDPQEEIRRLQQEHSRLIVTVNELGCGIVPIDAFDREWREVTGRICCDLAKRAQAVYRMTCGISTRLK